MRFLIILLIAAVKKLTDDWRTEQAPIFAEVKK
jgi:hypothetical protein